MKCRSLQCCIGLLLVAIGVNCVAENHVVIVGGYSASGGGYYGGNQSPLLTFRPSQLAINAGDTVTFRNAGGMHNVHSDDGSATAFQCSDDCDHHNAPSSDDWAVTVAFPDVGTIHYHCDQHVNQGMRGTITVKAVEAPSFVIGGYISGNWYTLGQGGQGFQLEAAQNNNMVAIWFVYSPDGGSQNWIYAQGNYDTTSNTVTLPAIILSGSAFPPNFNSADLTQTSWGTLTFTFTDCNTGTVSWNSTLPGYGSGSAPLTRLTQIDGTTCPQ